MLLVDNDGKVDGESHVDGTTSTFEITFDKILAFATGARSEPPLGFGNQPSIAFQNFSPFPTANTCANVIKMPLQGMSFEKYSYCMSYGILNTAGFGRV